jgi:hypothetical protein
MSNLVDFNPNFMWWGQLGKTLVVNKRSTIKGREPMYVGDILWEQPKEGKLVFYELTDVDEDSSEDYFFTTRPIKVTEPVEGSNK